MHAPHAHRLRESLRGGDGITIRATDLGIWQWQNFERDERVGGGEGAAFLASLRACVWYAVFLLERKVRHPAHEGLRVGRPNQPVASNFAAGAAAQSSRGKCYARFDRTAEDV